MFEKNKLTFMGDPVWRGKWSKPIGVLMGPNGQAAAVSLLFSVAAHKLSAHEQGLLGDLVTTTGWWALASVWPRMYAEYGYNMRNLKSFVSNKVINTLPDANTPLTRPEWMRIALQENQYNYHALVGFATLTGVFLAVDACILRSVADALTTLSNFSPMLAHHACGLYRSNKVLDETWVIENKGMPPKRVPIREKIKKVLDRLFPPPSSGA